MLEICLKFAANVENLKVAFFKCYNDKYSSDDKYFYKTFFIIIIFTINLITHFVQTQ